MDFFFKHIARISRRFKPRFPVQSIGYIQNKQQWIDFRFETCNFSFILNGRGTYKKDGKTWPVEAPCVLTQWPGEMQYYGPDTHWEELFIIFDGNLKSALLHCSFLSQNRPVWYIRDYAQIQQKITELKNYALKDPNDTIVDRLDLFCESLILESIVREYSQPVSEEEKIILRIQSSISKSFKKKIDFDQIAVKNGMSPSTFRRYWIKHVKLPPARYLMQLRIREATRLLVETEMPVGEIAENLNFGDPLYFSRVFRKKAGMTATDYRRTYQKGLKMNMP